MNSREIIKRIKADGWTLVRVTGDHHHFRHPEKPGLVTIPHLKKDISLGTLKSIERQSGLSLR
jgi:predicted RNA binding protein YcfA (HicA-like mRNA interferase family)